MTRQLARLAYGRAVNRLAGEYSGTRQERKEKARNRLGGWRHQLADLKRPAAPVFE